MDLPTRLVRAWNRLKFRWRRERFEAELTEELAFHLEQKQAENLRAGAGPEQALVLTRRQIGNVTRAREDCRDMWSFLSLEQLAQDLRHAVRMYGRTPVFTAISVLSLALGIGGNAAMFSLVNTLLVRPLPYAQPERLVRITGIYPRAAVPYFQQRSQAMEVASVSAGSEFNLTGTGQAKRVTGSQVTPNFLSVLGTSVAMGRDFRPGEDGPGRDGVVILSDTLWKVRFGGDPSVLGRIVRLDGRNRTIIGIMPARFHYPSAKVELWVPMRMDATNFLEYWGTEFMPLVARLRPTATLDAAQSELRGLVGQFRGTFPYVMARDWNADSTVIPLQQDIVGDVRGKLLILLASVGLVLLIACANVASLLLARATTRRKELALRAALGASRMRVIRQLLTESVGLAMTGAALGILLGAGALSIFKSLLPPSLPGLAQAGIDWPIIAAVTALALVTGVASGLAPALSASQVDITETIKTGGQRATSGVWTRVRGMIIAGEVALTLVLLVSAGLLLRSLWKLAETDLGFDPARMVTVQISPNQSACAQRTACLALYDRLIQRVRSVGGVEDAAVANSVPLDGQVPTIPGDIEGHPKTVENPAPMLWFGAVSPGYFRMMHTPLLAGRLLSESDGPDSELVVVIPASTAKRFWPNESAIGKHLRQAGAQRWRTIVGVVGDVRQFTLSQSLPAGVAGAVYMPYAQADRTDGQIPAAMTLLAKVAANDSHIQAEIQRLAADQDPNVPVGHIAALEDTVSGSIADFRSMMQVFLSFAGAAILLAAVGIYGLMSYWVSQRAYEIGLRVAIGATRRNIVSMILRQGLRVALYGVLAGLGLALLLTRSLQALLYGVTATDTSTFLAVTVLVLSVAALATVVPAWRATRIDPVRSLRAE
ncbi:ABC transporter permease [uncultured Paludibaculum sp.]|uniref:ABC transporter permease n=1 Tax=uncultured Paludibaculum sp. TaxID=1765020 RepID=UPI002AAB325F|nr:ABC transporter permease [uncultured Paludibaculum sp.]